MTGFITHEGLFRFCRVSFGITLAPSVFQKMLSTVLQGLPNVANHLDDIIVWGRTQSEHDCMLNKVVQHIQSAGLQLNTLKCQVYASWVIQCLHKVFVQMRIILKQWFIQQFLPMHISFIPFLDLYHGIASLLLILLLCYRHCLFVSGKVLISAGWKRLRKVSTLLKKLLLKSSALALFAYCGFN